MWFKCHKIPNKPIPKDPNLQTLANKKALSLRVKKWPAKADSKVINFFPENKKMTTGYFCKN